MQPREEPMGTAWPMVLHGLMMDSLPTPSRALLPSQTSFPPCPTPHLGLFMSSDSLSSGFTQELPSASPAWTRDGSVSHPPGLHAKCMYTQKPLCDRRPVSTHVCPTSQNLFIVINIHGTWALKCLHLSFLGGFCPAWEYDHSLLLFPLRHCMPCAGDTINYRDALIPAALAFQILSVRERRPHSCKELCNYAL